MIAGFWVCVKLVIERTTSEFPDAQAPRREPGRVFVAGLGQIVFIPNQLSSRANATRDAPAGHLVVSLMLLDVVINRDAADLTGANAMTLYRVPAR